MPNELSGQGPLTRCCHLEREHILVLDLVLVMLGHMLRHGVLVVIGLDLLFMAVNPRIRMRITPQKFVVYWRNLTSRILG